MKKSTKRILAFLSAAAMALSLTACAGGNGGNSGEAGDIPEGKLFAPGTEISMVIGSHNSWPYEENWKIWQYFKEATGAEVDITAIPNETLETKINLMLASPDTLPDLIHSNDGKKRIADANATTGAFIALDDHFDEMPNFTKFIDSMEEDKSAELLNQRRSGDGKIYYAPIVGAENITNLRTWIYRKDIFEKHNLSVPTTMDELYEVCKELKKLYPDSYPLCFRQGLNQINVIAPAWRSGLGYGVFYDFENEKWCVGAQEPEMLDMVKFFIKMNNEGLVPPDYLTIDLKSWEGLVSTNRGFIMPEYLVRLDFFNLPARKDNPEFTFAVMNSPESGAPNGQPKISKGNIDPTGYLICNTGKKDRIANAIKIVDWFYSDEGATLMNWGKEGETYQVDAEGNKSFILGEDETAQQVYGFATQGSYLRVEPGAQAQTYSAELRSQVEAALNNIESRTSPGRWLAFNDDEQQVIKQYLDAMNGFIEEGLSKFMLGQRPLSEWDSFVADIKEDMNSQAILDVYTSAYNRMLGK